MPSSLAAPSEGLIPMTPPDIRAGGSGSTAAPTTPVWRLEDSVPPLQWNFPWYEGKGDEALRYYESMKAPTEEGPIIPRPPDVPPAPMLGVTLPQPPAPMTPPPAQPWFQAHMVADLGTSGSQAEARKLSMAVLQPQTLKEEEMPAHVIPYPCSHFSVVYRMHIYLKTIWVNSYVGLSFTGTQSGVFQ